MAFGAVQGLAEFLPISSSGHLLLMHNITHYQVLDDLTFDVALHAGTLVALMVVFWRDIGRLLKGFGGSLRHWRVTGQADQKLTWLVILATIPGLLAGMLFEHQAETIFRSPLLVASTLILMGGALWLADRWAKRRYDVAHISWWTALWIGLSQAVAIVPGVSRSGATMTAGRMFGLTREAAARFSFYLAIPITLGAVVVKTPTVLEANLRGAALGEFTLGLVTAALVGMFAIRFLLQFVSRHGYGVFAAYRFVLGAAVIAALVIF